MKNKKAIITGASRGIGAEAAKVLASHGFDLTLTCYKNTDLLEELAGSLSKSFGTEIRTFTGDLSDPNTANELFKGREELDVLVNNAGISLISLLQDTDLPAWEKVINTNLSSAFYLSRLAIPLMLKKHSGRIINISSVWGNTGASMETAYCASKGGLNALTRALAKELAPSNIQVNAIALGLMDTDMNSVYSKEELNAITEDIPAGRMGRPSEAGELIYLLCIAPEYLTGQVIGLDGGWQL